VTRATGDGSARARWCLVTRKFPPGQGGMERQSFEICTRLAQRHAVSLIAAGVVRAGLPMFFARAALRILAGCIRREIALVHVGDGVLAPLALVSRAFGVPTVATVHGLEVVYPSIFAHAWRRPLRSACAHVICVSETTRDAAIAAGVARARTTVIGNGVDASQFAASGMPRESETLLFVGRLVRRKGVAWFIEQVFAPLVARRQGLRLIVVGEGPERARIEEIARACDVASRVRLLGTVDAEEKRRWLGRAGICVLPNIHVDGDLEGFGIVALEAAAAGCPVIAADIEGLRDAVVDGRTGVLVPAGNATAWMDAIERCLADPLAASRGGEGARAFVRERFDWDRIADAYAQLFERVADEAQARAARR